jgi:hypothetical protein
VRLFVFLAFRFNALQGRKEDSEDAWISRAVSLDWRLCRARLIAEGDEDFGCSVGEVLDFKYHQGPSSAQILHSPISERPPVLCMAKTLEGRDNNDRVHLQCACQ